MMCAGAMTRAAASMQPSPEAIANIAPICPQHPNRVKTCLSHRPSLPAPQHSQQIGQP